MIDDDLGPRLSKAEAAQFLGISLTTLDRLMAKGGGPSFLKIGGQYFFPAKWLKSYLLRNAVCNTEDCDEQGRGD
jgi:hypothetical protein